MAAKASDEIIPETDWTAVAARALAFLCLDRADMRTKTFLEQSKFLERFGIPRREAARILASTDESLRVAAAKRDTAKTKPKGKAGTKPKSKAGTK